MLGYVVVVEAATAAAAFAAVIAGAWLFAEFAQAL